MSRWSSRDLLALAYRNARAHAESFCGITARRLERSRGRAAVLAYHRVLPDSADASGIEPGMYVRASTFARHLEWLAARFRVGTLGDLFDDPPGSDHRPTVALTFDDGWLDNLTVAWPLLQQAHLRATIFLVRDWVVSGVNGEGEFMRPLDVAQLSGEGMEFGAHTSTHPRLDRLDRPQIVTEMTESRAAVKGWTRRRCRFFAFPYGAFNQDALDVAASEFDGAVTVEARWWRCGDATHRIPRVGIHQDMTATRSMLMSRLAAFVDEAAS